MANLAVLRNAVAAVAMALIAAPASAETILFVGNSFTFGATSAAQGYRPETVSDLNGEGIGGVPAIFKAFTRQAGLDYQVSLETSPGKGLDWHYDNRLPLIDKPWDVVVMHGYSTLDAGSPGDPGKLVKYAGLLAATVAARNPKARIFLEATWARADQTYPKAGHWAGQPIAAMSRDIRKGYDLAMAGAPAVRAVLPVGEAWNRAMVEGMADPNPYDGVSFGQVDLWGWDHYHGSAHGYYLSALVIFGGVTGRDPRSLGPGEQAAAALGISPTQATALQNVAFEELAGQGMTLTKP